jgi:hypothetical protein
MLKDSPLGGYRPKDFLSSVRGNPRFHSACPVVPPEIPPMPKPQAPTHAIRGIMPSTEPLPLCKADCATTLADHRHGVPVRGSRLRYNSIGSFSLFLEDHVQPSDSSFLLCRSRALSRTTTV